VVVDGDEEEGEGEGRRGRTLVGGVVRPYVTL